MMIMTAVAGILLCFVLELILRVYHFRYVRKIDPKRVPGLVLTKRLDHNVNRMELHSKGLSITLDHAFSTIAEAGGVSAEESRKVYVGESAFEKWGYRPFVGFSPQGSQHMMFASLGQFGFQGNFSDSGNYRYTPKKKNVKRVIALGGSAAFGLGQTSSLHNWCAYLEKKLNEMERSSGSPVQWEVINMAFSGSNTTAELNMLNIYGRYLDPDYVIQLSGYNDMYFFLRWNKLYSFLFYEQIYFALKTKKQALVQFLKGIAIVFYGRQLLYRFGVQDLGIGSRRSDRGRSGNEMIYPVW